MAVAANALVTLANLKTFLGITGTADDAKLETVIDRCADQVELYCNRPLKEAAYSNIRLAGPERPKLYLFASPVNIVSALTVKVNDETQTIWKQESDGKPEDFDVLVGDDNPWQTFGQRNHLWRDGGWGTSSSGRPYNVLITYTGGFAAIPDDLQEAAMLVCQKLWRDQQKALADVATVTLPSGNVTMFDALLPRRARWLLEHYRVIPI